MNMTNAADASSQAVSPVSTFGIGHLRAGSGRHVLIGHEGFRPDFPGVSSWLIPRGWSRAWVVATRVLPEKGKDCSHDFALGTEVDVGPQKELTLSLCHVLLQ